MKPSKALSIARKNIKSGLNGFICYALPDDPISFEIRNYILNALNGYGTYGNWMYIKYPHIYNSEDQSWRVKGRLEWIDWMISEYKKIGQ